MSRLLADPFCSFRKRAPCLVPPSCPRAWPWGPDDRLNRVAICRASCSHLCPLVRPLPKPLHRVPRIHELPCCVGICQRPFLGVSLRRDQGPLLSYSGPFCVCRSAGVMASENKVQASVRSPRGTGCASTHIRSDHHVAQAPCGPHSPPRRSAVPSVRPQTLTSKRDVYVSDP